MDWLKEQAVAFVKAYGWQAALVFIVALTVLAVFVIKFLGIDVGVLF